MGSYCKFCGHRCFVVRILPAESSSPHAGRSICLATCSRGMEHDRKATGGYDHTSTVNPVTGAIDGDSERLVSTSLLPPAR